MRKGFAVLMVLVLLASTVFAAGGSESTVDTTADGKRIVKWIVWDAPESGPQQMADAFMAANPDIEVQLEQVPFDRYEDKVRTMLASGEPYDLIQMNDDYTRMYMTRGLVQPIDEYVTAAGIQPEDYYESLWNFGVYDDGQKYGFVPATKVRVIYYNKDMVDAAGLPDLPHEWADPEWDWDAFLEYCKALTIRDGEKTTQWGFVGIGEGGYEQSWINAANGNGLFGPNGETLTGADEGARKAIQYSYDLIHTYKVHPLWGEADTGPKSQNLFLSGQAAMYFATSADIATIRNQADFNWDIAPIPVMDAEHTEWANNEPSYIVYGIPKSAPNPEDAGKLIAFMGTEECQMIFAGKGNVPGNKNIAAEYFNQDTLPPEHKNVILEGVNYAKPVNFGDHTDQGKTFYRVWLHSVWIGDNTVDEAMDGALSEVPQILAEG